MTDTVTQLAPFQGDSMWTPETRLLQAERQLENYAGNRFANPEYYALKAYVKEARRDYNEWKTQQEANAKEASQRRSLAETASADFIKKSATELDASQKLLRDKAVAAQDALVEFLNARQELEDSLIRITQGMNEKGLAYEDGCQNGAHKDAVRLNGKDYSRTKSAESHLAWVVSRVGSARINNRVFNSYFARFEGVRNLLTDVPEVKPAKFSVSERIRRFGIRDIPGLFIEPDKDGWNYKQAADEAKRRGPQPIGTP